MWVTKCPKCLQIFQTFYDIIPWEVGLRPRT
nr:MAG TPA: optinuerin [Caudoviricetes sp.]